jgi:hypothetical protein
MFFLGKLETPSTSTKGNVLARQRYVCYKSRWIIYLLTRTLQHNVLLPNNPHAIRHRPAETDPRRVESTRSAPTNEDSLLPSHTRGRRSDHESQGVSGSSGS